MFDKFKERYRLWKIWSKRNLNGRFYKILVLFGLVISPTFQMMPSIDEWERANEIKEE